VAGTLQTGADGVMVQQLKPGLARDLLGGGGGDDAKLGLGLGQRRLDIEPRLPAGRLGEQGTHARVWDAQGGGFFLHGSPLPNADCGPWIV
jgi:hypothetical protein